MSSEMNLLENNEVELTITVDKKVFDAGREEAYQKNKHLFSLPGFRKGKVPRKMVEMQFGQEVLYEDAIEAVFSTAYNKAVETHDLSVVSRPSLDNFEVDEEGNLHLEVSVTVKPEVHIDGYTGLTYVHTEPTVEDIEIEAALDKEREQNARIITLEKEEPIEDGFTAVIDFEGFVDEEAFDGGKGDDFELVIGSHSFIDNFEEQLIGYKTGDDIEVNVTFPEAYHSEELAGKEALFKVQIKEVRKKELPLLDDDFAQDISEFDSLDELKANIEKDILLQKEEFAERDNENQVMEKLIDLLEADIPEVMFENQLDNMVNDFASRLNAQGMDLQLYLQYMGQNVDEFREGYRESAEKNVKLRLALEAVADAEDIQISEDEVNEEFEKMADMYQLDIELLTDMLTEQDKKQMIDDLKVQKSIELVMAAAESVDINDVDTIENEDE